MRAVFIRSIALQAITDFLLKESGLVRKSWTSDAAMVLWLSAWLNQALSLRALILMNISFSWHGIAIKVPTLVLLLRDATTWLPSECFDVVVLSNILEHINDRQQFLKYICNKV